MSDTNERSVASTGSVGEPLAYAVMQPDSYVVVHSLQSAFAMRDMCGGGDIVPLYRTSTLTETERLAIEWAAVAARDQAQVAVCKSLRRLLERTK